MSAGSIAMITILSSDNEDVEEVQSGKNGIDSNRPDDTSTNIRRVPLQRIVTGKEMFSEFLEKCKSNEKSPEMERIVKKLWKRFNEADESYTKSRAFKELVLQAQDKLEKALYSTMKTVADELSNHKKSQTKQAPQNILPSTSASTSVDNDDEELDPKTLMHIHKLEKILENLNRRIQKLESIEVDLNSSDEENSAYVQVDRYKNRFCQVFQKLCELKKKDPNAERVLKKNIKFSGTQIPEVNKAIEKFYNDQREFPDYRDILTVVNKANEVKKLNLTSAEINGLALKAFQELGKTLKKYRQLDDVEIFRSYISNDDDPASKDESLQKTLEENKKMYGNRIDEIIDKYAIIQDEQLPESREINSDVEDEEEESGDEDPESDMESRSSILGSKSDMEDLTDEPDNRYPDCRVVLTDVRHSPAWDQYVLQKQNIRSADRYPVLVIESSPSCPSRKRSSNDLDNDSSDEGTKYSEPIASTSKQLVPTTLSNFRHIKRAKIEKRDETTRSESNEICIKANTEKTSTENDSDVIEIISDSCDKINEIVQLRKVENVLLEAAAVGNGSDDEEIPFSNDNFACSTQNFTQENIEIVSNEENLEMITDDVPTSLKSSKTVDTGDENSKSSKSVSKTSNDSENESKKTQPDSKSPNNDIIDVDFEDQTSNSNQHDPLSNFDQIPDHFLCNGDSLPLEVVLDVDSSSKSAVQNSQLTAKNIDSDDIVVIDEIVKAKTPTKVSSDVIDVEEISDSPEKPKKIVPQTINRPVNLSQIIRNMNFKPETLPKNRIIGGASKPVTTMARNNLNQARPTIMKPGFSNFRQLAQNTASSSQRTVPSSQRTVHKFPNAANPPNRFMNSRQPLNGRQFGSIHTRNVQNVQYFSNNSNVTMKSAQTAMQRKQYTQRTVQTFDSKTNRVITRKEITTVVQQSFMQVVGQNPRSVNRQMQQINRQRISSNRSTSSNDIITLD